MRLDINQVYHSYILKVVIFSLFTFKNEFRNPDRYRASVHRFVKKRLPWDIKLRIDTGERLDKQEERNIFIDEILNGEESDYLSIVRISMKTPLKSVEMEINLKQEERYESFLYR